MVFSLVSSAQEWLNVKWDEYKKDEENREQARLEAIEEAERVSSASIDIISFWVLTKSMCFLYLILKFKKQKKFEGTRVTVETFLTWRNEFERDIGIAEKREKQSNCKKLTGRELFMRDTTLNESDLKFLEAAGDSVENVKIDESLFQNLDDLEFNSDEDDDEDYVPGADDSD